MPRSSMRPQPALRISSAKIATRRSGAAKNTTGQLDQLRSHTCERSWSNCPVVFFAAPDRRVAILAELIRSAGCGLIEDRGMLKIYAPSVRETHALAQLILKQRSRFTSKPRPNRPQLSRGDQLGLLED